MGGIGSGRRYQQGKHTTSDCRSLDVSWMNRQGMLGKHFPQIITWSRGGEKIGTIQIIAQPTKIVLNYRHSRNDDQWQSHEYAVRLDLTSCQYGGQRPWFLCPARGCGRRVAILYLGSCGIFACRHCYNLAYDCQRESFDDRACRRAEKIRDKLAWEPGILNGNGIKPKGMHWKTYRRLTAEHDAFVNVSLEEMERKLAVLQDLL